MKTHQHELFHFHCDVLRQLLGGQYHRLHEEALAVAWSRLKIIEQPWNSRIGRMNRVFYHQLLDAAFAYRSPGYRDWVLLPDATRFSPRYWTISRHLLALRVFTLTGCRTCRTCCLG
ncbi:hypothetical protein [uncultured Thiocystis sp.]|jgi:hypothetical protein|uniref:hypothetical protein n=1 Tax=uncultured Thiocystis sp. TaxID=1202134 RepID=UPI0025DB9486|nr:hypothetical protein [uncultured Thiocystis sp.]